MSTPIQKSWLLGASTGGFLKVLILLIPPYKSFLDTRASLPLLPILSLSLRPLQPHILDSSTTPIQWFQKNVNSWNKNSILVELLKCGGKICALRANLSAASNDNPT